MPSDPRISLDAVAEQAGVSKGELLYHLPTKASLIIAIVERHLETVERSVGIGGATARSPPMADGVAGADAGLLLDAGGRSQRGARASSPRSPRRRELLELQSGPHTTSVVACLRRYSEPEVALMAFLVVEGLRCLHLFNPAS